MAKHVLILEAPDTLNLCILPVVDRSVYADTIPYDCPQLSVTVPGFNVPVIITDLTKNFTRNLTACDLDLQTVDCGTEFFSLSDGIYILKYSVAPNEYAYVEYNHLRLTKAYNDINEVYCKLNLSGCEPEFKKKEKLKELQFIEQMFKAAKAYIEWCHKPGQGMDIYTYARKRLDKLICKNC